MNEQEFVAYIAVLSNPILSQHKESFIATPVSYFLRLCLATTFSIVAASGLYAQQFQVTSLRLTGGNHLVLSTNGSDVRCSHQLSEDKRKISIRIPNAVFSNDVREANSPNGRIQSAFVQRDGSDVVVSVVLRDKSGYTTNLLPYSRSVVIDVFDWSALSAQEDNYRSGLIALDNNILSTAKSYFSKAQSTGHADATAYMGFLAIREGNMQAAELYMEQAIDRKSNLPDVYGALTQINREKKNDAKAHEYEQEFTKRTGRLPYFDEERIKIEVSSAPSYEPTSLVLSPRADSTGNSTDSTHGQSATNDTNSGFENQLRALQGTTKQANADSTTSRSATSANNSFVPSWFTSLIFGFAAALVMVGILLIRSYSKWKREQLLYAVSYAQQMQQKPTAFDGDLQQAMNNGANNSTNNINNTNTVGDEHQAVHAYKKAGALLDRTDDALATTPPSQQETPTPENTDEEKSELFDFDDSFYQQYEQQRAESQKRGILTNTTPSVPAELFYQTPGKAELSANIINEQQRIKQETVNSIQESGLPADDESLERLARQLGVEKGMLQATQRINSIEQDGELKKSLAKKFATE